MKLHLHLIVAIVAMFGGRSFAEDVPLRDDSAKIAGYTVLKSEDGKHTVQLATFEFAQNKKDRDWLSSAINSDVYWDHFRGWPTFVQIDGKDFRSGPRLLTYGRLLVEEESLKSWRSTFVFPGDVKLSGTKLTFRIGEWDSEGRRAKAELTEQDLKAATVPFRATIKETGISEGHTYVLFATNHAPWWYNNNMRFGDVKPLDFIGSIHRGEKEGWRHLQPDELIPRFKEAPPADTVISLKFNGFDGWYRCETVVEKPKKKQ